MKHIRDTLEDLRGYIAAHKSHDELLEIDALLSVALEEVRRRLAENKNK